MAEIAEPITGLFLPRPILPAAQIHPDLQVFFGQDLRGARLVHGLGFPVHDESEGFGTVGRDEADGRARWGYGFGGGETLRVADGAEDAAPVCVFAVQGRFDEGVAGDGRGDEFGVGERGRVDDPHADELGGSFAVSHDELGELLGEVREHFLHGFSVFRGGRGDGLAVGGAVGEDGEGVVGACAAVYGFGVEGALDGGGEEGLEGRGWDGGVGAEDAEEGGHVGMDHAGAFGHSCY